VKLLLLLVFLNIESMRDLTAHEVVDDRIDSTVEVAEPVRDQGEVCGVVVRQTHTSIPTTPRGFVYFSFSIMVSSTHNRYRYQLIVG
jgi:hypothetical protein